jgi:hypothetical protein
MFLAFMAGMVQSNKCDTPVIRIGAEPLGSQPRHGLVTGMRHTDVFIAQRGEAARSITIRSDQYECTAALVQFSGACFVISDFYH